MPSRFFFLKRLACDFDIILSRSSSVCSAALPAFSGCVGVSAACLVPPSPKLSPAPDWDRAAALCLHAGQSLIQNAHDHRAVLQILTSPSNVLHAFPARGAP